MKDRSLIDKIILTFIALTWMAVHHCLSAWNTGELRVPQEFGPGGGAQRKCNTSHINHAVNNVCTDIFRCLVGDFHSSSPEVQTRKIDNILSIICWRINSTGTDPTMAQPHNDQGSFDKDFLDYVPEELIEQPDYSFNHLSSFVAATEASRQFSVVLPVGKSAISGSSPSVPSSNSNSNSNDIPNITNITSVGNMG